jgi:tetratricopeptide (TPR) repeat protein
MSTSGDPQMASLQATVRDQPEDLQAQGALLLAWLLLNRPEDFVNQFKAMVQAKPQWTQFHFSALEYVAGSLAGTGPETNPMNRAFAEALERSPDDAVLHYGAGLGYQTVNQQQAAIDHFQATIRLDPVFAPGYHNLGLAYYYQNKSLRDKAIEMAHKAIENSQTIAEPHLTLGSLYMDQGNSAEAEYHFLEFIRLAPPYLSSAVPKAYKFVMQLKGQVLYAEVGEQHKHRRGRTQPWWKRLWGSK